MEEVWSVKWGGKEVWRRYGGMDGWIDLDIWDDDDDDDDGDIFLMPLFTHLCLDLCLFATYATKLKI